eukprot:8739565-Prorocentrum_lima.AAC.1
MHSAEKLLLEFLRNRLGRDVMWSMPERRALQVPQFASFDPSTLLAQAVEALAQTPQRLETSGMRHKAT